MKEYKAELRKALLEKIARQIEVIRTRTGQRKGEVIMFTKGIVRAGECLGLIDHYESHILAEVIGAQSLTAEICHDPVNIFETQIEYENSDCYGPGDEDGEINIVLESGPEINFDDDCPF